jgi:sugar lactone lactonase YvrE
MRNLRTLARWLVLAPLLIAGLPTFARGTDKLGGSASEGSGASHAATSIRHRRQSAPERFDELQAAMRAARKQGNWHSYLIEAGQLKQFLNAAPDSLLELARAQVHVGNQRAALDELTTYVRMGQASAAMENLREFDSLRQAPAFKSVRASLLENRRPLAQSSLAFQLADPRLLPEDIDYDAPGKRFFITSILGDKIVSTTGGRHLVEFAQSPDHWPMMALKIDSGRHLLWATEVAMQGFAAVNRSDQGRSAILCYDLRTGKLLRRVEGPRPSSLGDMALTKEGDVIVSDGDGGGIYRLPFNGGHLKRIDNGDFMSPQTVAVAADGVHVYVPDYVRGIGVLDIATKQVRWLSMRGRFALSGADGLYLAGNRLIVVQNGLSPQRITVFTLDASGMGIVADRVVERSTKSLGTPTHGVVVGSDFYYIANSGWDALDEHGQLKSGTAMSDPTVRCVSLQSPIQVLTPRKTTCGDIQRGLHRKERNRKVIGQAWAEISRL